MKRPSNKILAIMVAALTLATTFSTPSFAADNWIAVAARDSYSQPYTSRYGRTRSEAEGNALGRCEASGSRCQVMAVWGRGCRWIVEFSGTGEWYVANTEGDAYRNYETDAVRKVTRRCAR